MCQGNVVLGHDNTSILGWELETKGKTEENKMLFWPSVDHLGLLWFKKKKHFDGQTCPFGFIRCLLLIRPVLGSFHYNSYTWTWLINRLVRQEAEKILNRAIPSKKQTRNRQKPAPRTLRKVPRNLSKYNVKRDMNISSVTGIRMEKYTSLFS